MRHVTIATINSLWRQVKDTGKKVATFLFDDCNVSDIVVIAGIGLCLL